jgi:hypothetical protein
VLQYLRASIAHLLCSLSARPNEAREAKAIKSRLNPADPNSGRSNLDPEVELLLELTALSESLRHRSPTRTGEEHQSRPRQEPTRGEIELRAYHIFLERGGAPGRDLADWIRAKEELLGETWAESRRDETENDSNGRDDQCS